jgi:hypothetical protein
MEKVFIYIYQQVMIFLILIFIEKYLLVFLKTATYCAVVWRGSSASEINTSPLLRGWILTSHP